MTTGLDEPTPFWLRFLFTTPTVLGSSLLSNEFAEAVIDEVGIEHPLDENPGNLTWLLAVPIVGFFAWLLLRKPDAE